MAYLLFLTSCSDLRSFMELLSQLIYLKTSTVSHVTISKNGNVACFVLFVIFKFDLVLNYIINIHLSAHNRSLVRQSLKIINLLDGS